LLYCVNALDRLRFTVAFAISGLGLKLLGTITLGDNGLPHLSFRAIGTQHRFVQRLGEWRDLVKLFRRFRRSVDGMFPVA
jgi:hypothetical protein